jgi:predicted kinase
MKKLIILRGNSGSGKSSVAHDVREHLRSKEKCAIIEQDYVRRIVLQEKEADSSDHIILIERMVRFSLSRGYVVILEGILQRARYKKMFDALEDYADVQLIFYFDVSFEETLRRHATKSNAHEFGEVEMRKWWREKDLLSSADRIIDEALSRECIVEKIVREYSEELSSHKDNMI